MGREDISAEEARVLAPHSMISGAYWCPNAALPHLTSEGTRHAVLLRLDGTYACPVCGECVAVPTCGGDYE